MISRYSRKGFRLERCCTKGWRKFHFRTQRRVTTDNSGLFVCVHQRGRFANHHLVVIITLQTVASVRYSCHHGDLRELMVGGSNCVWKRRHCWNLFGDLQNVSKRQESTHPLFRENSVTSFVTPSGAPLRPTRFLYAPFWYKENSHQ